MLTDKGRIFTRDGTDDTFRGVQHIYRISKRHGLSLVNGTALHSYPFAWEAAVLLNPTDDGYYEHIVYDTPLSSDVEVFRTDEEANAFIEKALVWGKVEDQK